MVVFNPLCPVRFSYCYIVFTFAFLFRIKLSVSVSVSVSPIEMAGHFCNSVAPPCKSVIVVVMEPYRRTLARNRTVLSVGIRHDMPFGAYLRDGRRVRGDHGQHARSLIIQQTTVRKPPPKSDHRRTDDCRGATCAVRRPDKLMRCWRCIDLSTGVAFE